MEAESYRSCAKRCETPFSSTDAYDRHPEEMHGAPTRCSFCHNFSPEPDQVFCEAVQQLDVVAKDCATCSLLLRIIEPYRNAETRYLTLYAAKDGMEPCTIRLDDIDPPRERFFEAYISPHAELDWTMFSKLPMCREVSVDSSTPECLELARQWLFDCVTNHRSCSYRVPSLPRRVIKLGSNDGDLRLYIPGDLTGNYVALSHCWGTQTLPKTMLDNLESRKEHIPLQLLSKTFQDAIVVTRYLGLKYLWIDSLCILQDSIEDWQDHAGIMGSIYANAYVTIAAAGANIGSGGCFHKHETGESIIPIKNNMSIRIRPARTLLGFSMNDPYTKGVNYTPRHVGPAQGFDSHSTLSTPIETRAWTFQERMLSPRTLHFTQEEMVLECREKLYCECCSQPENIEALTASFLKSGPTVPCLKRLATNMKLPKAEGGMKADHTAFREWLIIIQEYSSRLVTFTKDRLSALAGVASTFASRFDYGGEYRAGLWLQHLPLALLWYPVNPFFSHAVKKRCRSHIYVAPTWSWASLLCPVKYNSLLWDCWSLNVSPLVQLCDVSVSLQAPASSPCGAVTDGRIILFGMLIEVVFHITPLRDLGASWPHYVSNISAEIQIDVVVNANDHSRSSYLLIDVTTEANDISGVADGDRLHLLPIVWETQDLLQGIVLKNEAEENVYQRFGSFRISCSPLVLDKWTLAAYKGDIEIT